MARTYHVDRYLGLDQLNTGIAESVADDWIPIFPVVVTGQVFYVGENPSLLSDGPVNEYLMTYYSDDDEE